MKINTKMLQEICDLNVSKLQRYLSKHFAWDTESMYFYKNVGSKVLAVAHMDTVGESGSFRYVKTGKDVIVASPNLDDRLGIYAVLDLLPQFGIEADILFTDNEECCDSTAQFFPDVAKEDGIEYNWIVEFDRAGEDVVLYGYKDTPDLKPALEAAGFSVGQGSYSDICELYEMQTGALNMGVGYHFQHTPQCIASIGQLGRQLSRLESFYKANYEKKFFHEHDEEKMFNRDYWKYRSWTYPKGWDYYGTQEDEEDWVREVYGGKRKSGQSGQTKKTKKAKKFVAL